MKDWKTLTFVTLTLALTGCGICKKVQPPVIEHSDSTTVIIHNHVIHDSIPYEVVKEVEKIVTRDTASHLENRFGISDAIVSNGLLFHSLETKPQTIKVPVDIEVSDTTKTKTTTETIYKDKIVEKELTWWQKARINAFWWLLGIGLVGWRREIIALVKYIIKLFTKI